jgi:hypothetical protein
VVVVGFHQSSAAEARTREGMTKRVRERKEIAVHIVALRVEMDVFLFLLAFPGASTKSRGAVEA